MNIGSTLNICFDYLKGNSFTLIRGGTLTKTIQNESHLFIYVNFLVDDGHPNSLRQPFNCMLPRQTIFIEIRDEKFLNDMGFL